MKAALEDVVALAMFAQRSPNMAFRDSAFALALAALTRAPLLEDLLTLCAFAARSQAKGAGAERAREIAKRLLRETGQAELRSQFAQSLSAPARKPRKSGARRPRPARAR